MPTCPHDSSALVLHEEPGFACWWCERCDGTLLDRAQIGLLKGTADTGTARTVASPAAAATTIGAGDLSVAEGALRCDCGATQPMATVRRTVITIDVCRSCGSTWLDRGELEAFLATHGRGAQSTACVTAGGSDNGLWLSDALGVVIEVVGGVFDFADLG